MSKFAPIGLLLLILACTTNADLSLSWVYSPYSTQVPGTPESVYWMGQNLKIGVTTTEDELQNEGI